MFSYTAFIDRQTFTTLSPNTLYYFRFRSVNASGQLSTNPAFIRVWTLLATPGNLSAVPAAAGFTLSWQPVDGATGYLLDVSIDKDFGSFVGAYENFVIANGTTEQVEVTGLKANASYYYRLRATSNLPEVTSLPTPVPARPPVTTLPAGPAPTGLSHSEVSSTGFTLSWEAVADATGYRLDLSTEPSFDSFVTGYDNKPIDGAAVVQTEVTGLDANTLYHYRLRAVKAAGETASTADPEHKLRTLMPPPASLSAVPADDGFTLSWEAVADAAGYYLDVATDEDFEDLVIDNDRLGNANTTRTVRNLISRTTYYYRLRAQGSSGVSGDYSNTGELTTTGDFVAVRGVTLDKAALRLFAGEEETLTAIVSPPNANNQNVTWSSSDATVAAVLSNGVVRAAAEGTAVITVTTEDGGYTASCDVTVRPVSVTAIILNKTALRLAVDATEALEAVIEPENASNKKVTWSSSDTTVATVSGDGVVRAVAEGMAVITITTEDGDYTASCEVTVEPLAPLGGTEPPQSVLSAFPVPTSGTLHLRMKNTAAGSVVIRLSDISGKPLRHWTKTKIGENWEASLDLSDLPSGLYSLEVLSEKERWTRKVLKQ